jgi:hypothetical protein
MGFAALPHSFWNHSLFTQNWSRDMLCVPWTAFDFKDGKTYRYVAIVDHVMWRVRRVKACANDVTLPNFIEAHRLMAQTYYQYSYRQQPVPFREAANPSFTSALADAITKLVPTQQYFKSALVIWITVISVDLPEHRHTHTRRGRTHQRALPASTGTGGGRTVQRQCRPVEVAGVRRPPERITLE